MHGRIPAALGPAALTGAAMPAPMSSTEAPQGGDAPLSFGGASMAAFSGMIDAAFAATRIIAFGRVGAPDAIPVKQAPAARRRRAAGGAAVRAH